MAYTDIHVNGPAVIYVAKSGVTPVRLGVTDEGVKLRIITQYDPVMSDDLGSYIPADLQFMGTMGFIAANLVRYDETLLEGVRAGVPALSGGAVTNASIGMLTITSGNTYEVYIESSARTGTNAAENPWRFQISLPTDPNAFNLGTRYTKSAIGFTAYPNNGRLYVRA